MLVGLTGGIGSGKSAAADYFATLGIDVVDADLASRAVVEPGQPALSTIAEHFGAGIVDAQGHLDRAALRKKVFSDVAERKWLQQLLHPLINTYLVEQVAGARSAYCLLVNPLLIESGQQQWCDSVIVVDVPVATQLTRTMDRDDNTREQVQAIIDAQASREQRLKNADFVITNDRDLPSLYEQIDALHNDLMQQCQNHQE
ncbi:MAG: dephospho-CoA kinase [Gammaproteobacteria bacterium]|nr:dephospho-CoA kinase [Gammaproteobacteria bacterium]|tara:strand:- start:27204 stop:27806 length:603 start_codon:yes stop_codon:yes gene_type:complete